MSSLTHSVEIDGSKDRFGKFSPIWAPYPDGRRPSRSRRWWETPTEVSAQCVPAST